MKSYEILKQVVESVGAKQLAHDLGVSSSLVYKWCEGPSGDSHEGSGTRNPLDRIVALVESTQDRKPVEWLCAEVGGCFVETREVETGDIDMDCLVHTNALLAEFARLLLAVSDSIVDDGRIDTTEASVIRDKLTQLQGKSEAFVRACEQGVFDSER